MEAIQLWQAKWSHGPYVPMYLFFGGLTAGVFVVAVLADWLGIKWRQADTVSKVAAYTAVVALGASGFFLTIHLGKPERGLAFPIFFTNFDSWMTRGGWIVGISTIFVGLYVVLRYLGWKPWLRRLVGVMGVPVLTMLAIYTGLLLTHAGFVPLWSKQFFAAVVSELRSDYGTVGGWLCASAGLAMVERAGWGSAACGALGEFGSRGVDSARGL